MAKQQNGLTYEDNPNGVLETYEWNDVWWEKNRDTVRPRIMYLGDSISCGIRRAWNQNYGDACYCDNCATSKAIDNRFLLPLATQFMQQMVKKPDVIFINNGLHGWHLSLEEYAAQYESFLQAFCKEAGNTPVVLVKTTSVSDSSRNAIVIKRNEKLCQIAEKQKLSVVDLYVPSESIEHTDGVHLSQEGYLQLAAKIFDTWNDLKGE